MEKETLITNPDIRILHQKGVFFAGQLSGTAPPVRLVDSDIVLLALLCKGGSAATIVKQLHTGKASKYLPDAPSFDSITGRIRQLQQKQVLIPGAGISGTTAQGLADCADLPEIGNASRFRLSSNFALEPNPVGFSIWCAGSGKHHILSLELTLLLIAFSDGKTVAEIVSGQSQIGDKISRALGVSWLVHNKLLVRVDATPFIVRKQSQQVLAQKSDAPRWRDIKPDGRVPVYFAPHMPNHYPLALGMICAFITSYKCGALLDKYLLLPLTYLKPNDLLNGPYKKFGRGVWLFSNYMWSLDFNMQLSDVVKKHDSGNITIHGGPSTPSYAQSCADFMAQHPSVDIAVHGEGEVTSAEILEALCPPGSTSAHYNSQLLAGVDGLTFRNTGSGLDKLLRTNDRARVKALDDIPSPYTLGVFDVYDVPVDAAIIESTRGCPFGCTFCDWGSATKQKVRKFDLDRVKDEIEWIGKNSVHVLWIADANFGMYDRDIELAKWICHIKEQYGYPSEVVVNYTKNATKRLAEIIKVFTAGGIISQGIISIQTTDEVTLEIINRKNIKTEKYDELTQIFADEGLPLSTDLMIGLPGITVGAFDRDLQRYIDVDVDAKAYPTKLLPNSPMADPEYIKKYNIKVDENDFLISCNSYTESELKDMKLIYSYYVIADGYSVLRYVIRYLQWDHDIPALTFLHKLCDTIIRYPENYPSITWAMKHFSTDRIMPGGWNQFYNEIARFTNAAFGVQRNSAFYVVLRVNELVMPDDTMAYPATINLDHDFANYFCDHTTKSGCTAKSLTEYQEGAFTVDGPDQLANPDTDRSQYDNHQHFWELRSAIARNKSASRIKKEKSVTS